MPSFDLMDKVELFVRTGTFSVGASRSSKKVTRAASKHFIYRDGLLWRSYRGRFLRVVRSDDEVREILTRYHDNNNHAGRTRAVKEIMLMYYWVGVTEAVKSWIKACGYCQSRTPPEPPEPPVRFCLAYGCDSSSYVHPELSFHRFPKEPERRKRWLELAQRDEGSLRMSSCLCSRHFEPSCFALSGDGQLSLRPDAVPIIIPVTVWDDQAAAAAAAAPTAHVGVPADENFLQHNSFEELLCTAAAAETSGVSEPSETRAELLEHQYSLPAPDRTSAAVQPPTAIEPCFAIYNQIARYLSHRVLPIESKKSRFALKRMSKRFGLTDGVLMYTRVSPPLKVPRTREEVNSIMKQFHDNQGHYGQGICQRAITKHFYWNSMTRDLSHWINNCSACLNRTKRKWLRCSVSNCTNCCGPVERGLGLTFHKFPLHNELLLAQWLKAVGRSNWHPRLRSSICSAHFTKDSFERSGEKVALLPGAVPTLLVHGDSPSGCKDLDQPAAAEEAYFAKYDAVDLYLSRRKYPPGLTYVEKNTFRRFCKKFAIKDGELHAVSGDQLLLVLRSKQQVEAALVDYHNELNHLDANKCLRLLNERYFWKTMRSDVVQWIHSCPQCSSRRRKQAEMAAGGSESQLEALSSTLDDDSGRDEDDDSDDEGNGAGDADEGRGCVGDEEQQPETNSEGNPQPRIPILLHLRSPFNLQPKAPIIFNSRTPSSHLVTRIWSVRATPPQPDVQDETSSLDVQPEDQSGVQVQLGPQPDQTQAKPLTELPPPPEQAPQKRNQPPGQRKGLKTQNQTLAESGSPGSVQRLEKRKRDAEVSFPGKKRSGCGQEPLLVPTTKPWPISTAAKTPFEADSLVPPRRPKALQARTIMQQCSAAKVKTKPALDGVEAQWAEIQEGMVVYVCFFHGATEDVTHEMASRLMTTKLFRKENGRSISLLDLPGSILLIPQESLVGRPLTKRRIQYKGGCEQWWGAQLFSTLVTACRELMAASAKCTEAGGRVEQGVYGPKQEIVLNSEEPLTLLLEF